MGVTDWLALYGAILSTGVAGWKIYSAKSKIRVILVVGVQAIDEQTVEHGLNISIQNPSNSNVHVTSVAFLYPHEPDTIKSFLKQALKYKQFSRHANWCMASASTLNVVDGSPITLEPGKSHDIFVSDQKLRNFFEGKFSQKLKVAVQDALWRDTHSNEFDYSSFEIVIGKKSWRDKILQ